MAVVITPTISLMQDQTLHLEEKGISATFLGSAQIDKHADESAFSKERGSSIVFVTPELLYGNDVEICN